ncbi:MAG: bifunctional lysylphosphatidylglycerol flippase/synthetase MprF [Rhodobacteraceae bacterium]|nr:bifunctional lysylphosphatidylglycerol flippase/synthetase MprF [Paracoccaceae bacterium]
MTSLEDPVPPGRLNRVIAHPVVRIVFPLLIAGISLVVLHTLAAHVSWTDVKADLAMASKGALALAVAFTALSYAGIACYDLIAMHSTARGQVPAPVALLAGASSYAVSNVMGFSYLTGTAIRLRIYGGFGLDAGRIAGVFATSWVAFWLGLIVILGVLLVGHPVGLGGVIALDRGVQTGIGVALLAGLAVLFAWLSRGQRRLGFGGMGVQMPSAGLAALLTGAAVVDMLGAALTLYVLLPNDLVQGFPYFFVIYVGAIAAGVLSHSPGGLGVFEATIIAGLGAAGRSDVLAALLLYRVAYFGLPFVIAVVGLALAWSVPRHGQVTAAAGWANKLAQPLVPPIAAGIALIAGLILMVSGNLPADGARLGVLGEMVPLTFIQASHLAGSIAGLLLVVIARGLYHRRRRAWLMALVLMGAGLVASLAKGLDWVEALSMLATMGLLWLFRPAFYRVGGGSVFRLSGPWLVGVLGLMAAVFWVGLFAYSHISYTSSMWWDFALHGDASRFLRASLAVAVVLTVITFNSVVMNRGGKVAAQPIPDVVRRLVAESEDSEAGIALMGDKAFLIAPDQRAFVAYADTGTSLIAKGDPVGDPQAGQQLIWQLREQADRMGRRCAFYAVSSKYLPTYLDMGLSILKIGEVARVPLDGFTLDGSAKKDFRHARNRAARDGFVFEIIPSAQVPSILEELRAVSDAWLQLKQGEEKSFALGAFEEGYIANFDIAVLRRGETAEIVAFANLMKGANRHEVALDLMRYRPGGPSFAMDALFGELLLWAAGQGYHWFSLGAAPFAGLDNRQLASLWNRIGGFVYQHGEHFYNFEGLRSFKQKFDPVWTPNYLAGPGGLAVPRILYEVNVLISGGVRGLMK